MAYVSPVISDKAIIDEGPVLGTLDPEILVSAHLHDLDNCWEMTLLPAKLAEWPALRLNADMALRTLEAYQPNRGRLLDFGCGFGFFLRVAGERRWTPYGLEPLPGHAVYARLQSGADVVTDVLRDDSFPPDYFDAVTSFQVFEHLPHPDLDAARLYRMLKPGGVLLIEVPRFDTWSVRLLGSRHRHFVQDHLNFFTARSLGKLLEDRSFHILASYSSPRLMTIHHLVSDWGERYLPDRVLGATRMVAQRLSLWDRVIALNLGDILTVLARKPV